MLTSVYRYGPSRQRILKGFVVAGQRPERIASEVLKQWSVSSLSAFKLSADSRFPTNIWVDTGLVWLHTPQARSNHFNQLAEASRTLAQSVSRAGGKLLPNAVRLSTSEPWEAYLCSDRHLLETLDDSEKEVYCNLLRNHLPVLIALTGRAGVSPRGVEPVASRHLADSSHHLAARYLASVSPQHLQRVVQCLRRDQGVGRIELLDVCPLADDNQSVVEIRFNDGQMLLSSVRAQALLYQALLIKARRLTRSGRRIGNVRQSLVERNRARAITDGLQARLEVEGRKPDERRGPKTSTPTRQGNNRGDERNFKEFLSAREAALILLEDLAGEFHVLDVEFAEIAPLVIGAGLRSIGLSGLQNESDLMREWLRQSHTQGFDLLTRLPDMVYQFSPGQDDALTALNKNRFGQATTRLERWWELLLRTAVSSRSESVSLKSRDDRSSEKVTGRSTERDGRHGDRGQREHYSNSRRSGPAEGGKPQQHGTEHSAQHQQVLTQAATELLKTLHRLGTTASKLEYSSALIAFQRTSRTSSLNRAAAALSATEAEELGGLLEHMLINPHVSDEPARGWDAPACRSACEKARREGLASVLLRASVELENKLRDKALRMTQERPTGIGAFFLQRQNYDVGGEDLTGVRLVLVRTVSEADVS